MQPLNLQIARNFCIDGNPQIIVFFAKKYQKLGLQAHLAIHMPFSLTASAAGAATLVKEITTAVAHIQ